MSVYRDLLGRQSYGFHTSALSDLIVLRNARSLASMHRCPSRQIRQLESLLPITAISSANQIEQRLVLRDWHRLSLTHGPASRGKTTAKHSNLANKWFSHFSPP